MARKSISKKRKKRKQKTGYPNSQAPLCALGTVLGTKEVFEPIHQGVAINQKTVAYRPTDKLVLTGRGSLSGA